MPRFHYRGGELDLTQHTHIMGILNITPDSFSDGGRYDTVEAAVERALAIQAEGADVLDIGAQSTRPGHIPVTAEEEWGRLRPVLEVLSGRVTIPVSIDTYYPEVAARRWWPGRTLSTMCPAPCKTVCPASQPGTGRDW